MKDNLVLIGMMGCGKSTVGGLLAKHLHMAFVDTDQRIEQAAGCTILELFDRQGEDVFRNWEKQISEELAEEHGLVIACGGGLPLRADCITPLRRNGIVVFLDRDGADIYDHVDMENRPLGQVSRKEFLDRWQKRLPVYQDCADYRVVSRATPEETARDVLNALNREKSPCGS